MRSDWIRAFIPHSSRLAGSRLMVPGLVFFLLFSFFINCTSTRSMEDISDLEKLITYERTPCFGYCPVYEVTILRDGWGFFVGRSFVPYMDTVQFEVPTHTLNQIRAILNHPDYLNYVLKEPEYFITDIPGLNLRDFINDRAYELDQIIPPGVEKITKLVDPVLVKERLIYDPEIYPMVRQEILVELKPGTDPYSLEGKETRYQLSFREEVGAGIYKYEVICSQSDIDQVLTAIRQRKGVRETQLNHKLERRDR